VQQRKTRLVEAKDVVGRRKKIPRRSDQVLLVQESTLDMIDSRNKLVLKKIDKTGQNFGFAFRKRFLMGLWGFVVGW